MKIVIYYFSGTGNTKKVVEKVRQEFLYRQVEIEIRNIEVSPKIEDISSFDKIGIAYPVHAFNAPSIVLDFARSLPKLEQKREVFILKTSGEPLSINAISSLRLLKILRKKNYLFQSEYHYVMPYNILFRHSHNMVRHMWNVVNRRVPQEVEEILSGKKVELKRIFLGAWIAHLFRIEHWGGRFNGKHYRVTNACTKCLACARNCPTQNIQIKEGKLTFDHHCLMCMRCCFSCPNQAIKIGFFERWKVTGPYSYENSKIKEKKRNKRWCRSAYRKYFQRYGEEIQKDEAIFVKSSIKQ